MNLIKTCVVVIQMYLVLGDYSHLNSDHKFAFLKLLNKLEFVSLTQHCDVDVYDVQVSLSCLSEEYFYETG